MFSFYLGPDIDILFEKLTAQIGTRLGLGTLLRFEDPSGLRVEIFCLFVCFYFPHHSVIHITFSS